MEEEQIGLDFDIDDSPQRPQEDAWRSESESTNVQGESDKSEAEDANKADSGEDGVKSTVRKLKRILDLKENQLSEDNPIWPHQRKKRHRSVSMSIPGGKESQGEAEAWKQQWISQTLIADIYGQEDSPKKLCELEMKHGSLAAVLKIMPQVSVDQICQIVELHKDTTKP